MMSTWKHGRPKPVIGLAGGIGSGKSAVGKMFCAAGCAVINSDKLAHYVLQQEDVKEELRDWFGGRIFNLDGSVNRKALAREILGDPQEVRRVEGLIHPRVAALRDGLMVRYMADPAVKAVIWDTPLLLEAGLQHECDAVVFVDSPREVRLARLAAKGAPTGEDLERREKLQFPLDKKAKLADYCIDNSGDEASSLRQVQRVLSQIIAANASGPGPDPTTPQ